MHIHSAASTSALSSLVAEETIKVLEEHLNAKMLFIPAVTSLAHVVSK